MQPYFIRGNADEILRAKKEYRKVYKRNWKKLQKKKVVSVECSMRDFSEIQKEAKRHHKPVSAFIREATKAYMNKTYLVPDEYTINKILQVLKMMLINVEDACDLEDKRPLEGFLLALQKLETDLRVTLLSPIDLHTAINKYMNEHPDQKQSLHHFIETI